MLLHSFLLLEEKKLRLIYRSLHPIKYKEHQKRCLYLLFIRLFCSFNQLFHFHFDIIYIRR